MLYYVSRMDAFTREHGDIDEGFYISAEETFRKATLIIDKIGQQKEFFELVRKTAKSIIDYGYWWWFSDQIGDYYYDRLLRNDQKDG